MAYVTANSQTIADILSKITLTRLSVGTYSADIELKHPLRIKLVEYLGAWKHFFKLHAKANKDDVYIERDILDFNKIRIYADPAVLEHLLSK